MRRTEREPIGRQASAALGERVAAIARDLGARAIKTGGAVVRAAHLDDVHQPADHRATARRTERSKRSPATIIAASSNVDVAFVIALQTARFMLVLLVGPRLASLVARYAGGLRAAGSVQDAGNAS